MGRVNDLEDLERLLPHVARTAIRAWLDGTSTPAWPAFEARPVFVTLRNPDGSLRGCIGSLAASEPDLASETGRSAVLAASSDPRFPPLSATEAELISVEVSVLGPEESVSHVSELDPKVYGVIVRSRSGKRGLLLPDIPGVEDVTTQLTIARRKAGITDGETVMMTRFRVWKCAG